MVWSTSLRLRRQTKCQRFGLWISRAMIALFFAGCLVCVPPSDAEDTSGKRIETDPTQASMSQYSWYDGLRERKVWLNPSLVVEFYPIDKNIRFKRIAGGQLRVVEDTSPSLRIWKVENTTLDLTLRDLRNSPSMGQISPMFQDLPDSVGIKRALPGGVIVWFNSNWSDAQVMEWSQEQGLSIVKKIDIGPQVYLIETAAGLASLETANRINQSGEVESATPNWWVDMHPQ
jgi:hypothetical protein